MASSGSELTSSAAPANRLDRHLIHTLLGSLPAACFVGALVTDIAYWRSTSFVWETFSVWLLTAGLVLAALAVIAGLIDLIVNRRRRDLKSAWAYDLGGALAIVLSLFNVFIHSRDGYTAVVPTGITLSFIVVVVMVVTALIHRKMLARRGRGVVA